jgi:uncharacterized ubiquitin-like protein YukD
VRRYIAITLQLSQGGGKPIDDLKLGAKLPIKKNWMILCKLLKIRRFLSDFKAQINAERKKIIAIQVSLFEDC